MKRILQFLLSFVSLALGCVSCLTEVEVGGCNNAVVRFEYMADGAEDCFAEYISAVDYYIYDEQGKLVAASRLDRKNLENFQGFKLRLPQTGTYRVVCWGNMGGQNTASATGTLAGARVCNREAAGGALPGSNDPLYLGSTTFTLTDVDGRKETMLRFHAAHITFKPYIVVAGQTVTQHAACPYEVKAGMFPAETDFEGKAAGEETLFRPSMVAFPEQDRYGGVCELPLFEEDTQAVVMVFDSKSGEKVAEVSLREYMAEHGIRLAGKEEIVIEMLISISGTNVTIKLPVWEEDNIFPA